MRKRVVALLWLAVAACFGEPVAAGMAALSNEVANLTAAANAYHAAYAAEAQIERKLWSAWLASPQHVATATDAQTADDEYEKAFADHSHATPEQRRAAHDRLIAAREHLEEADRNWSVDAQPAYRQAKARADVALRSWTSAAKALADDPLRGELAVARDIVPPGCEGLTPQPPASPVSDAVPSPRSRPEQTPSPTSGGSTPPTAAPIMQAIMTPALSLSPDDEQWRSTQFSWYQRDIDDATRQLKEVEQSRTPWRLAGSRSGREWGDDKRATIKGLNGQVRTLTARLAAFDQVPSADVVRLHRQLTEETQQTKDRVETKIRQDYATVEQAGQTVCRLVPVLQSLKFDRAMTVDCVSTWWNGTCTCKDGTVRAASVHINFYPYEIGPKQDQVIGYVPTRVLAIVVKGDFHDQLVEVPTPFEPPLGLVWDGAGGFLIGRVPATR